MMRRLFACYDSETEELVREYYAELGYEACIPRNAIEYLGIVLSRPDRGVLVVSSRLLRAPAKLLGIKRVDAVEAPEIARRTKALWEACLLLNLKGVPCYFYNRVGLQKSGFEYAPLARQRMERGLGFPSMCEDYERYEAHFREILGERASEEYVQLLKQVPQIAYKGDTYAHEDVSTPLVTTIQGMRVTTNQPDSHSREIHVYGRCGAFGYAVEDADTLPSFLQRFLRDAKSSDVKVVNHGLWGADDASVLHNFIIDSQHFTQRDIVLFYMKHLETPVMDRLVERGLAYRDITEQWHAYPEAASCFYDRPGHMNSDGYRNAAEIIAGDLLRHGFRKGVARPELADEPSALYLNEYLKGRIDDGFYRELDSYIDGILSSYPSVPPPRTCGAIVMNCNPFTKGHRHLIEYASGKVDVLYIFVVEENRSRFAFEDRMEMVRLGTSDIPNVRVCPSGAFMISTMTFPEYFLKDYVKEKALDPSRDLGLFCEHIAPRLRISIRFAGEEPVDPVTANYNKAMSKILPEYGIRFCEIPRLKASDGKVVNATQVRRFVDEKDVEGLEHYVPDTTLRILRERYFA